MNSAAIPATDPVDTADTAVDIVVVDTPEVLEGVAVVDTGAVVESGSFPEVGPSGVLHAQVVVVELRGPYKLQVRAIHLPAATVPCRLSKP